MRTQKIIGGWICLILAMSLATVSAQSPAELLEKAVFAEETKKDELAAIPIYRKIISQDATQARTVAEARFRLGRLLIKRGKKEEGIKVLLELIEKHPKEADLLIVARKLAETELPFIAQPWKSGEVHTFRGYSATNQWLLDMVYFVEIVGDKTNFHHINFGPMPACGFSFVETNTADLSPIRGDWGHPQLGLAKTVYSKNEAKVVISGKQSRTQTLTWEGSGYDNEQVLQLMRALNWELGKELSIKTISPLGGIAIPFNAKAAAKETLTISNKSYDAWRIDSNIGQIFWIADDERRTLLQLQAGAITIKLHEVQVIEPGKPKPWRNPDFGLQMEVPHDWFNFPAAQPTDEGQSRSFFLAPWFGLNASIKLTDLNKAKPTWKTLDGFRKTTDEDLKKRFDTKNFRVRPGTEESLMIDGKAALYQEEEYDENGKIRRTHHLWVIGEDVAVDFGLVVAEEDSAKAKRTLLEIAKTFKFTN